MPSSFFNAIPTVLSVVTQLKPESILDIGVGYGKWGHLFREYTDIAASGDDPPRYQRENWKVRIDGVEGFEPYLTPTHRFNYNNIYVGKAQEVIKTLGNYDVIFMGDVIEHFTKDEGNAFLDEAFKRANKAVLLSTPWHDMPQEDSAGNDLERHKSHWTPADFRRFPNAVVAKVEWVLLVAALLKPGMPRPNLMAEVPLTTSMGADRYLYLLSHPKVALRKLKARRGR